MKRLLGVLGLGVVALCGGGAIALAPTPPAPSPHAAPAARPVVDFDSLVPDPAVRRGVLPNGLRYAVLSHAQPAGAASILFRMHVGSLEEADGEQGAAHFLEHVAFAGGKAIPRNKVEALFANQSVSLGRDQNATTSAYETTYRLDLPKADKATLDLTFAWLSDVAYGLDIDKAAVDSERGIILRERAETETPAVLQTRAFREFLAPELRVVDRDPIGQVATVSRMGAPDLRRFYERWYRPDRAEIVVVGDAPVDELEARVRAAFGKWRAKGSPPAPPVEPPPDLRRAFDIFSLPTYSKVGDEVALCTRRPAEMQRWDTVNDARREALRGLWVAILDKRLKEVANRPAAPFNSAIVDYTDDEHELAAICLRFSPYAGDWRAGLKAAYTELRRLQVHGPTDAEVKVAMAQRLGAVRFAREETDGYSNAALAASMLSVLSHNSVVASMEERYRAEASAATRIDARDVHQAMIMDLIGGGPLLAIMTSASPTIDDARDYWIALSHEPEPGAYTPPPEAAWSYAPSTTPGRVVSREAFDDPVFVRLRFSNGVVLNYKQASFAKNDALVAVTFGGGREELPGVSLFAANLGTQAFTLGGLGKDSVDDLNRLFAGKVWSTSLAVEQNRFTLYGRTSRSDLSTELEVLSAYLTDPAFNSVADPQIATTVATLFRDYRTRPFFATDDAFYRAVAPLGPLTLPSERSMANLRAASFEPYLKPILTHDPLEVTVVSDLPEAEAVDAVSRTLGALPPRTPGHFAPDDRTYFRIGSPPPPGPLYASYQGDADKAAIEVVWALYVGSPERRGEEREINLMSLVFEDALRHRIRNELGDAYSPSVSMNFDDAGDQTVLKVIVQCKPSSMPEVLAGIRAVAGDMAAGKITTEELEAARRPLVAQETNARTTVDWWVHTLNGSARNPVQLADAKSRIGAYSSISLERVRAAAKTWLTPAPYVIEALPAPPPQYVRKKPAPRPNLAAPIRLAPPPQRARLPAKPD